MADTSPISNPRARWQGNTAPIVRARVSATARCSFSTARARLHGAIAPENAGDGPGQRPHGTTPRRPKCPTIRRRACGTPGKSRCKASSDRRRPDSSRRDRTEDPRAVGSNWTAAIYGAACICVVDCSQFSALQCSARSAFVIQDSVTSSMTTLRHSFPPLRIFTVRRFAEFSERYG
jgi:hypothetical protein